SQRRIPLAIANLRRLLSAGGLMVVRPVVGGETVYHHTAAGTQTAHRIEGAAWRPARRAGDREARLAHGHAGRRKPIRPVVSRIRPNLSIRRLGEAYGALN